ncbi:MAG: DUF3488 and transglutaminase-like domain-containing protein [Steroidobacteraceae bacterium]
MTAVLIAFAGAVLLNLHHVALWSIPIALAAVIWRARGVWQTQKLPGRGLRLLLAAGLIVGVLLSFRTLNGLAAGATLLVVMSAAKLLEARGLRDGYILCGTSCFLLLAACLDAQQIWRVPLLGVELWLIAGALRQLGSGVQHRTAYAPLLRQSGRALLWSLPLALLLFLVFPRLPGSFWTMGMEDEAITGLGDEMSPGSISRLSESDEPALRARFDGPLPAPAQRYWRGPVLHDFDGYTWRRRPGFFAGGSAVTAEGAPLHYEVTLEPASHNVLIALELARDAPLPDSRISDDYQILSMRPLTQSISYALDFYPRTRTSLTPGTLARRVDLALPANRNPRSVQLGRQLRAQAGDDTRFVAAVLDYFRNGGFEYSLTPPQTSLNSVDDFLFGSHLGFCGHFASAFTTLMRAGGVPARVVTGYLGGEWNPVGGYLTVRQSHAHAWSEVWLPQRGWVRVDPTAVVAPERLTRDIFELATGATPQMARRLRQAPLVGRVLQSWEALNAWYQDRVVGFNASRQLALLAKLGLPDADWRTFAWLLGGAATLWVLWMSWTLRRVLDTAGPDALGRAWLLFCRRCARAGSVRGAHEGPQDYLRRLVSRHPQQAAQLTALIQQYIHLRYASDPTSQAVADFTAQVRTLRLTPAGAAMTPP